MDSTHDLPHTVASNMVKVSHALNHSTCGVLCTVLFCLAGYSRLRQHFSGCYCKILEVKMKIVESSVILRTSRLRCWTCKVLNTDTYMPQNIRATEVPGCCRVTCLLLAVFGIVPECLIIVHDYSEGYIQRS